MTKTRAMLGAALVCLCAAGHAADTEVDDNIPEGVLAKMARISAKQGVDKEGSDRSEDAGQRGRNKASCGSLNVGNVDMGNRRVGAPVRQVTVIVKGDIVNANNKCR